MKQPQAILVLPHLRIQNANAIASPLTHGFPSVTAFTGVMWALERKLAPVGVPLQAVLRVAKETIYTARPALEIETAGFEVLGALLALYTNAVEAAAEVPGTRVTTRERMLLRLLPTQFLGHDGKPDADPYVRLLQVADFVAGMTDSYAVDMYRKLKGVDLPT